MAATKMKTRMIAEGVETGDQADWLRDMKCGFAQGHFFSKAIDAQAMELLLASRGMAGSGARAHGALS